jgi:hypothetical protein
MQGWAVTVVAVTVVGACGWGWARTSGKPAWQSKVLSSAALSRSTLASTRRPAAAIPISGDAACTCTPGRQRPAVRAGDR